jgi:hypothetical protein
MTRSLIETVVIYGTAISSIVIIVAALYLSGAFEPRDYTQLNLAHNEYCQSIGKVAHNGTYAECCLVSEGKFYLAYTSCTILPELILKNN